MKKIGLLMISILLIGKLYAQLDDYPGIGLFYEHAFNNADNQAANDAVVNDQNLKLAVGYVETSGDKNFALWYTDQLGAIIWKTSYGGANNEVAQAVMQVSNGGPWLVGGYEELAGATSQIRVDYINALGNNIWTVFISSLSQFNDVVSIVLNPLNSNEAFVLCNMTDPTTFETQVRLITLDILNNGNILNDVTYPAVIPNPNFWSFKAEKMIQDANGSLSFVGNVIQSNGFSTPRWVNVDQGSNINFQHDFTNYSTVSTYFTSIATIQNNEYTFCGYQQIGSDKDPIVEKFKLQTSPLSVTTIGQQKPVNANNEMFKDIVITSLGYVAVGNSYNGSPAQQDIVVYYLDNNLSIIFNETAGDIGFDEVKRAIKFPSKEEIYMVGSTEINSIDEAYILTSEFYEENDCTIPRYLLVDNAIPNNDADLIVSGSTILSTIIIGNPNDVKDPSNALGTMAQDLIDFALDNAISILLLTELDLLFTTYPSNPVTTINDYKNKLEFFIYKCELEGIEVGNIEDIEFAYDYNSSYNSSHYKNMDLFNLHSEGKLKHYCLEHEFWIPCTYLHLHPSISSVTTQAQYDILFDSVYQAHLRFLTLASSMKVRYDHNVQNVWDYVHRFDPRWSQAPCASSIYSSYCMFQNGNGAIDAANRAHCADRAREIYNMVDALMLFYPMLWDQTYEGIRWFDFPLPRPHDNWYETAIYQERLTYFSDFSGLNTENLKIIPLFGAQCSSWDNYLGNFLYSGQCGPTGTQDEYRTFYYVENDHKTKQESFEQISPDNMDNEMVGMCWEYYYHVKNIAFQQDALSLVSCGTGECANLTSTLLLPFHQVINGITNEIVNSNNGTVHGATLETVGKFNSSLKFDGIDDYVEVPNDPFINFGTNDFSISIFIKTVANYTPATNEILPLVAKVIHTPTSIGYNLYIRNGSLYLGLGDGAGSTQWVDYDYGTPLLPSNYNDGQWHNITVTVKRALSTSIDGEVKFYFDGYLLHTAASYYNDISGTITNSSPILIGKEPTVGSNGIIDYWHGELDEVILLSYVLSQSQVNDIINNGICWISIRKAPDNKDIEISNNSGLLIYPNPSNTHFNIHFQLEEEADAHIMIYSTLGQKVFEQKLDPKEDFLQISSEKLGPTGVYTCIITVNGRKSHTHKIIIAE